MYSSLPYKSSRIVTPSGARAAAAGRRLDILLQVNLSREEQKGGVLEDALPGLLTPFDLPLIPGAGNMR